MSIALKFMPGPWPKPTRPATCHLKKMKSHFTDRLAYQGITSKRFNLIVIILSNIIIRLETSMTSTRRRLKAMASLFTRSTLRCSRWSKLRRKKS